MQTGFANLRRALVTGGVVASTMFGVACTTDELLEGPRPRHHQAGKRAKSGRSGRRSASAPFIAGDSSRERTTPTDKRAHGCLVGSLTDEWGTASTFVQNDEVDKRAIGAATDRDVRVSQAPSRPDGGESGASPDGEVRPNETREIAELLFARSFAEMQLASDFCNAIPFSNAATDDGVILYGDPYRGLGVQACDRYGRLRNGAGDRNGHPVHEHPEWIEDREGKGLSSDSTGFRRPRPRWPRCRRRTSTTTRSAPAWDPAPFGDSRSAAAAISWATASRGTRSEHPCVSTRFRSSR